MGRVFVFNETATTEIYTLSLHDALPISARSSMSCSIRPQSFSESITYSASSISAASSVVSLYWRSEEHTSELQSRQYLVCRLLLVKQEGPERQADHLEREAPRQAARGED